MAKVIQVIETTQTRGNGVTTIMRGVKQYWSLEGDLLAEVDPCPGETERVFGKAAGVGQTAGQTEK